MSNLPRYDRSRFENRSMNERYMNLFTATRCFQVLPKHRQLHQKIDSAIRWGYVGRDPRDKGYIAAGAGKKWQSFHKTYDKS